MAVIKIEAAGEAEFFRRFDRLDAQFTDLTPIWPDVRDEFRAIEKEQFASEGGQGRDGRWQELSDAYKSRKVKQYGEKPILQASGKLMKSLTGDTADSVYRPAKQSIEIGTRVKYGLFHQTGSGNLPRRAPINFSERQRERLMKRIQGALVRELRRGVGYVDPSNREIR